MLREPGLGIILASGDHGQAHAAFLFAAGAAALDRSVIVFATGQGVGALCRDWSGLAGAAKDAEWIRRGVAGLEELRNASRELGVRLIACPTGLRAAGLTPDMLVDGAVCDGIAGFLEVTARAQLLSF